MVYVAQFDLSSVAMTLQWGQRQRTQDSAQVDYGQHNNNSVKFKHPIKLCVFASKFKTNPKREKGLFLKQLFHFEKKEEKNHLSKSHKETSCTEQVAPEKRYEKSAKDPFLLHGGPRPIPRKWESNNQDP